jgi:uncharacterized membrane protein
MSLLYVAAGINHFWHTQTYMDIMPAYIPKPLSMVYISGVAEIVLGILLIPKLTRRYAAWGIIFLLIAVFPANVQMMLNFLHENKPGLWLTILRLPLQILLIMWAYVYTKKLTRHNGVIK